MRIKVLNVGSVAKEKTYFTFTLSYESDGKTQDKKLFSFNGDAYKVLKGAAAGEQYDIELKKDDNGYWQWLNPKKAEGAVGGTPAPSRGGYETPAERARRQTLIIRQSALAQAVTFQGVTEKNVDELLELAERFENWVNRDFDPEKHSF